MSDDIFIKKNTETNDKLEINPQENKILCSLIINDNFHEIKVENTRNILKTEEINNEFNQNSKSRKNENFDDLKFNINLLKSSTEVFIQSIIDNNKYLIEYEKKKLKETQEDEEN